MVFFGGLVLDGWRSLSPGCHCCVLLGGIAQVWQSLLVFEALQREDELPEAGEGVASARRKRWNPLRRLGSNLHRGRAALDALSQAKPPSNPR